MKICVGGGGRVQVTHAHGQGVSFKVGLHTKEHRKRRSDEDDEDDKSSSSYTSSLHRFMVAEPP